ncbi:MAG: helix-turn-helix transcriptional regulator [Ferruginibacter sp.]
MNIGSAIKVIRKQKGLSQKDLAKKVNLSVNGLSLIETNASFPQKTTINAICQALDIPVSYLLFFSISEEDIPDDRKITFNSLNQAIKAVLLSDIK